MGLNILENQSLGEYISYKMGGIAKYLVMPEVEQDLIDALKYCKSNGIKYEIVGAGCNILFSSKKYDGMVISLREFEAFLHTVDDDENDDENASMTDNVNEFLSNGNADLINSSGNHYYVGAGVLLDDMVGYFVKNGFDLSTGEFNIESELGKTKTLAGLSGVPGSVGGAVFMNAGAFGIEMCDIVKSVRLLDVDTLEVAQYSNDDMKFGYRSSVLAGENNKFIVLGVTLNKLVRRFNKAERKWYNSVREAVLKRREERQPLEFPSCGSVFKRCYQTDGSVEYPGAVIEKLGLKGYRIGGVVISEKHANFFVNVDKGKAEDVVALIELVKSKAKAELGIELTCELRLVNF